MASKISKKLQKMKCSLFCNVGLFGHAIHNLMIFDITEYKFCTENFKVEQISKRLPKGHVTLTGQSLLSCSTLNVSFLIFSKSNFCIEHAQIFFSL